MQRQRYLVCVSLSWTSWTLLLFIVAETLDGLAVVEAALVAALSLWKDVVFASEVVLLLFRAVCAVDVVVLRFCKTADEVVAVTGL